MAVYGPIPCPILPSYPLSLSVFVYLYTHYQYHFSRMLSNTKYLAIVLVALTSPLFTNASDGKCQFVGIDDLNLENPMSKPANIRTMHRLDGNTAITTADSSNGVVIKALDKNKASISAGSSDVFNKNMFKLRLYKDGHGHSPWYWLDKGGWCYVDYDYLDIYDGTVYVLDRFGA